MPNFSQKAQKTLVLPLFGAEMPPRTPFLPSTFVRQKAFWEYVLLQAVGIFVNGSYYDKQNFSATQPAHNRGFATAELFRQPKRWRANRRSVYVKALRKSKTRKKQKTFSDKIASNQPFVSRRFFPTVKIIRPAKLLQQAKPRKRSFFLQPMFFRR